MLRNALLYLSNQPRVFDFVRHNALAKHLASRFVAGETADEAIDAVAALARKGATATLDLLGESVTNEREARESGRQYVELLDRLHARGLDGNVSLKLTAMGLDISPELCVDVVTGVLERARRYGGFVRLDMESSAYTQRTLDLYYDRLRPAYPDTVGIVLQSYLYRTDDDAARAARERVRVRLCKGAYKEPPEVAYPEKKDVDAAYVRAMHVLMRDGHYPGLATHDEAIIAEARRFAEAEGIGRERFEFQMLYGVRRDLQEQLVATGYRVRVYVPFGTSWYPYLMRRLAERPANVMFMTGSIVKEALGGRRAAGAANGAGSALAPGAEAFDHGAGRANGGGHEGGGAGAAGSGVGARSNGSARAGAGADVAGSGADRR
jgi:proline dehydrogenase